ncbi:hypothetical protein F511_25758 [Dorcoceras hygrometricum]|uniref:Uncharacterized protein n=1 Tax=Dorcoceras hygrometricum TaxID=472368 RepID=A0A2Z7CBT4_9LAMI|nr:hypothetical protein F511_25758 [Dorcoceras hygrometricum]
MAPASSPPPLRKLLRTDQKPKPVADQAAAPLNSASSSSTTIIPTEKRTRDQPNLSDCHSCGRRINHTNPKDRLQPLDSVWRIVLLCRRCRKKLNSGQTCPYCFKETEHSGNIFRCCVCQRIIHKVCAGDYGKCAPFCYLGVDLGFRVCVDCWVPDGLKNSISTCGRSEDKDPFKHKSEAKDSFEKTVKDANRHVEKVKMAVGDKDQALKKATVAKNAANNVQHILGFVRKNDRDEGKDASSDCSGKNKVSDDAELAIRLHRAMNSSPRMLRDKCQVNSCSDDLENGNSNGLSCHRFDSGGYQSEGQSGNSAEIEKNNWAGERSLYSDANESAVGALMYKREKKRKTWQEIRSTLPEQVEFRLQLKDSGTGRPIKWNSEVWDILVCVNADQSGSCTNVDRFGKDTVVYKRTRFTQKACPGNGMVERSSVDNCIATCEFQNHQSDDTRLELPLVGSGTVLAQCNTESSLPNGNCNAENDRYFLKYTRTDRGFKCGTELILPDGSCNSESEAESDRYFVKYSKRIKCTDTSLTGPVSNTFLSAKQACVLHLVDLQAVISEKCDGELYLPNGAGDDEVPGRYFFKYVKRTKGSHSGPVVEANLQSDTE